MKIVFQEYEKGQYPKRILSSFTYASIVKNEGDNVLGEK